MSQVVEDGKVRSVEIRVTTTGGAGVSTGNATSPQIVGQVLDVAVTWHNSAPGATSDVVVEGSLSGIDLYQKTDAATSVKKAPGVFPTDPASATGAALTGALIDFPVCIAEPIKVTVTGCNDLTDAVIVRVTYREVFCEKIFVTTTGTAGSATGAASSKAITGELLGFALDFHASAPGTTDITITGATTARQLYAKTNSVADVFIAPAVLSVDNAGSALASDITPRKLCVGEAITVTLAQADALTNCVQVYAFWEPVAAETVYVTTTGTAGSATGNAATLASQGEILGIYLDFHASAPGTTDITIAEVPEDANHTPANIYAKANSVTDTYIVPARFAVTNADAALTSDVTPRNMLFGKPVRVALAQCDALANAVKATIFTRFGS